MFFFLKSFAHRHVPQRCAQIIIVLGNCITHAQDVSCPRPALTRARDESDSEDELPPVTEMMRCEEAEVGGA